MSNFRCQSCRSEVEDPTVPCPKCGEYPFPKTVCQFCQHQMNGFPTHCPNCAQPLKSLTATRFLGQAVLFSLKTCLEMDLPKQAKKKAALYLKLCDDFLIRSELAYIRVSTHPRPLDAMSLESIEDVLGVCQQHITYLAIMEEMIAQCPDLEQTTAKVKRDIKRCKAMLGVWRARNYTSQAM